MTKHDQKHSYFDLYIPDHSYYEMVGEFITKMNAPRDALFWVKLIDEEMKELIEAEEKNLVIEDILKEIGDLFYVTVGFFINHSPLFQLTLNKTDSKYVACVQDQLNIVLGKAVKDYSVAPEHVQQIFTEIHKSNMSKLDDSGKPIISDGTDGKPKGKILKGPNYKKPDLTSIVLKWEKQFD